MLTDFSDPVIVYKKARSIFGPNVCLKPSTRKNKKYMLLNPETDKWVHFGYYGMQDYTRHKNKDRRDRFKTRNKRWADSYPYSPSFLSYWLLW